MMIGTMKGLAGDRRGATSIEMGLLALPLAVLLLGPSNWG